MVNLTLKGIPETLYERLKESSKANRRSINQEAIARLSESLLVRKVDPEETLARLAELRTRSPRAAMTEAEIRRALRRDRR
jgi:hypothetical protein